MYRCTKEKTQKIWTHQWRKNKSNNLCCYSIRPAHIRKTYTTNNKNNHNEYSLFKSQASSTKKQQQKDNWVRTKSCNTGRDWQTNTLTSGLI